MGTSQLKKLRASLKENGLIGQQSQKRKRQSNSYKNKKEKDNNIQAIRDAFNPFASKLNRQKVDVIGKKQEVGRPGLKKQAEEEGRRAVFEAEQAKHNRVGGIVDRRFGENNPGLSFEEKMQERFTKEHQRKVSKSSLFNLDDDEQLYEDGLGSGLSFQDDFDAGDLGLEDDEDGNAAYLARKAKRDALDAGDDVEADNVAEEPERKKSKAEVMKEVIAKSKLHKFERQQAKEEDLQIIDELDDEDAIRELMGELSKVENSSTREEKKDDGSYEQAMREMAFDKRSQPSDRTLTEEEKAKAEKEKQQRLNQERLERMNGETEGDGVEDIDFEDDFVASEDENEAAAFGFKIDASGSESESEDSSTKDDEDEGSEEEGESGRPKASVKLAFDCPTTLVDMKTQLSKQELPEQYSTIIKITKAYAPNKAQGNKELLAKFYVALIDYICWMAGTKADVIAKDSGAFEKIISNLKSAADQHVVDISVHFRECLSKLSVDDSISDIRGSQLFMFTLVGILYSTSDHYHLISTEAELFITSFCMRNTFNSERELFTGLYLCENYLSYQRHSKRYSPEVIYFLLNALVALFGPAQGDVNLPAGIYVSPDISGKLELSSKEYKKISDKLTPAFSIYAASGSANKLERAPLASFTLKTLIKACNLCKELSAYYEIVAPFVSLLEEVKDTKPKSEFISKTYEMLKKQAGFSLAEKKPLTMQSHRPIAIKTVAPKFDENYSLDRKSYNDAPEIAERRKLQAELKKEKKAAMRDIRKDSRFVAREKLQRKITQDSAYHANLARLERSIQTEEGAEKNKYEREKKKRR